MWTAAYTGCASLSSEQHVASSVARIAEGHKITKHALKGTREAPRPGVGLSLVLFVTSIIFLISWLGFLKILPHHEKNWFRWISKSEELMIRMKGLNFRQSLAKGGLWVYFIRQFVPQPLFEY